MAWPSGNIDTTALDSSSDSPIAALPALLAAVQQLNSVIALRGSANGIPSLDNAGLIPAAQVGPAGFQTGMGMDFWGTTPPSGWVFADGRTIGSAASAASNRANDDTHALFVFLWNNHPDAVCPVTGGRGATAEADWSANKIIQLIDKRGRVSIGKDDMGGTAAGRVTTAGAGLEGSSLAAVGGAQTHTLTEAQIPSHTHKFDAAGNAYYMLRATGSGTFGWTSGALPYTNNTTGVQATGGGQAHNNVQPSIVCNYLIKL